MSDDILAGGILPIADKVSDDTFDPDAVESDAFLPDEEDDLLIGGDLSADALDDDLLGIEDV